MAKPVLVLVDDEDASRQALTREMESRYGAHYRIVPSPSPEMALTRLTELRADGVAVPLVLADQWTTGMTGPGLWADRVAASRGAVHPHRGTAVHRLAARRDSA